MDENHKYIIKFSTDGAKLTNNMTGVQGTIKICDVNNQFKPIQPTKLPERFHREICVYYFIGQYKDKLFLYVTNWFLGHVL